MSKKRVHLSILDFDSLAKKEFEFISSSHISDERTGCDFSNDCEVVSFKKPIILRMWYHQYTDSQKISFDNIGKTRTQKYEERHTHKYRVYYFI